MIITTIMWAIFGGFLGSLCVALIGWFFGLRNIERRVDELAEEVNALRDDVDESKKLVSVLVNIADNEEFGKAVKQIMWRPD